MLTRRRLGEGTLLAGLLFDRKAFAQTATKQADTLAAGAWMKLRMSKQMSVAQALLGSWTLVSWEQTTPGGTTVQQFGANPTGMAVFDEAGHCIISVMRADRQNYAIENFGQIADVTAEESRATAQETITYFGTYSVNEGDRSLVVHVEASSFPNWNGTDQRRAVELTDGQLKLTVRPPRGGSVDVVWRRAVAPSAWGCHLG